MSSPSKRVVYIAGPFRGANAWEIEQNIRRAEELALEAWKAGAAVLCPHTNTRHFGGVLPDEVWLAGDQEFVVRSNAVLTTPDWGRSFGATAEVALAREMQIPIFHSYQIDGHPRLPASFLAWVDK